MKKLQLLILLMTLSFPAFADMTNDLQAAAYQGKLQEVKRLIQKGADVNARDSHKDTALHSAAQGGKLEVVKYLLKKGADVNAKNNNGTTPLHFAAEYGHKNVVKWLLTSGADANAKNTGPETPLFLAVKKGHKDIARILLSKGAKIEEKMAYGGTALHLAAADNNHNAVTLLISLGAKINAKDENGRTPLFYGVQNNLFKMIKLLISHGANINARDKEGKTPLDYAIRLHNEDTMKNYLIKLGAKRSPKSNNIIWILEGKEFKDREKNDVRFYSDENKLRLRFRKPGIGGLWELSGYGDYQITKGNSKSLQGTFTAKLVQYHPTYGFRKAPRPTRNSVRCEWSVSYEDYYNEYKEMKIKRLILKLKVYYKYETKTRDLTLKEV
ncbi:MAG: ankyrin repeat domain-containing protein, partial [Spirochaetota bacterium]|nr:ankyrin repeat domain-containing protein [Spirochaetota bacterium]